jgi:hypothetical protein
LLSYIAKLVNEDFIYDGGQIRSVPVTIGGSTYVPPMPMEFDVKEKIRSILDSKKDGVSIAIDLCLYCMKTQIFDDGNKRASVILANHYLIAHGLGIMAVKDNDVPEFKKGSRRLLRRARRRVRQNVASRSTRRWPLPKKTSEPRCSRPLLSRVSPGHPLR